MKMTLDLSFVVFLLLLSVVLCVSSLERPKDSQRPYVLWPIKLIQIQSQEGI